MKTVTSEQITKAVSRLAIAAAHDLEPDILEALLKARDSESSPLAKSVLEVLIKNADIASREQIPACQDTGICSVFVRLGQDVHIKGNFTEAVQEGVRQGYDRGFLRKSVCDVVTRSNTGTNTPAVIHLELIEGDKLEIDFLPKGCGSENMSGLKMLPPSVGIEGAVEYISLELAEPLKRLPSLPRKLSCAPLDRQVTGKRLLS